MTDHSPIKMEKAEEREPATAFSVPALPEHFVARPALVSEVVELLLEREWRVKSMLKRERHERYLLDKVPRVVLRSELEEGALGGVGKTTLAMAVCADEHVVESFADGIRWLRVGPQPDLLQLVNGLARSFDAHWPTYGDLNVAINRLEDLLDDKWVLLVLDDVWEADHAMPFLFNLPAYLITTRLSDLAVALEAKTVTVNQLEINEATALLSSMIGSDAADEPLLADLALYLGQWPLLLELVAAQVRQVVARNEKSVAQAVGEVRARLEARGLTAVDVRDEAACLSAFEIILSVSLDELQALGEPGQNWRERYLELAIFPEHVEIPSSTIFKLWQETAGFEQQDSQNALLAMRDLSLLTHVVTTSVVPRPERLKSLLRDEREKHEALLAAHLPASGKWADLPSDEPYMWRHLASHLCAAGQLETLGELLLDFAFMQAKLEATDINGLIADYEGYLAHCAAGSSYAQVESDIRQVQRALTLSPAGEILAKDKSGLASSLWAHLHTHPALIHTLRGHAHGVSAVAAVGERIVSAGYDGLLKVWDLVEGRYLYTITGHTDKVSAIAVTPDGQSVMSLSPRRRQFSDLPRGRYRYAVHGDIYHKLITLTPDGQWMILAGSWEGYAIAVEVRQLRNDYLLNTLRGHTATVTALAVTPDGQRLVLASRDQTLRVWDLARDRLLNTLSGHQSWVTGVAVAGGFAWIISASEDGTVKIWDLATGKLFKTLTGHTDYITAVAAVGERFVTASCDKTIKIWDLTEGECLQTLTGHTDLVTGLTINGQQLISASWDKTIKVWDLASGQLLKTIKTINTIKTIKTIKTTTDESDIITAIAAVGERIISASPDCTLKVWDLATGQLLKTLTGHTETVRALTITPDGKQIISGSWDDTLKVWDLASGECLYTLTGHAETVSAVTVTADGKQIISGSWDETVKVWDLATGNCLYTLIGHTDRITDVVVVGKQIISASRDKTLKVWRAGKPVWASEEQVGPLTIETDCIITALAITPDGQWLTSASGGLHKTLKIWNLATGEQLNTVMSGHTGEITAVAAVGERIISASEDSTIKVWDLTNGRLLNTLTGHTRSVTELAISPDGQWIISASEDETLNIWDLARAELVNAQIGPKTSAIGQLRARLADHLEPRRPILAAEFGSSLCLRPITPLNYTHPALIRTLRGHNEGVIGVAAAGQRIVSIAQDDTLKVWDLASGECLYTLTDHIDEAELVAVTPDGQRIISVPENETLKVWDPTSGKLLNTLTGHTGLISAIAVTPDGQRLISASADKTLKVWDLASGNILNTLTGHTGKVTAIAVTFDGQRIISASAGDAINVWDLASGQLLNSITGYGSTIMALAVTPNREWVILNSFWETISVWDLASGDDLLTLPDYIYSVYGVAVTPDGQRLILALENNMLDVWDIASAKILNRLTGHTDEVYAVTITPDGQRIISASADNTIKIWDLARATLFYTPTRHTLPVTAVVVTPDGQRIISGSEDQTIKIWDLASGDLINTLTEHGEEVTGVTVVGQQIISAGYNTIKLWDLASGDLINTLDDQEVEGMTSVAAYGQRIISASDYDTLEIWDLESGQLLKTLTGHANSVYGVTITPDGQRIISASKDKTLKVWDLASYRYLQTLRGHTRWVTAVAVTPDGKKIISASPDKTLKVWNLVSGRLLNTLTGHTSDVNGVAVTSDGKKIISASADKTVKVWDLTTGTCLTTFELNEELRCCALAPDGQTVVVGGELGGVYIFRLETRD